MDSVPIKSSRGKCVARRGFCTGRVNQNDMHTVWSMRAQCNGLLDVRRARRAGHEVDRARHPGRLGAQPLPGLLHIRHDAPCIENRNVSLRQKAYGRGRVAAGSEQERTRLRDAAERARDTDEIASLCRTGPHADARGKPVERGKLAYKPFALPAGFDMRDHATRVDAFGRAFVSSVTQTLAEYRIAVAWVERQFS